MKIGGFKLVDYKEKYGSIMKFNKNKNTYIHGWYSFVEGYSKEFIRSIVDEYEMINNFRPELCVEPFTGSGTTPLELQKLGIKCTSFEVSPFMYNLAKAKMTTSYTLKSFKKYFSGIEETLSLEIKDIDKLVKLNASKRIVEKEGLDKWNFNKEVMNGILDIKYAISHLKNKTYERLFTIALASILLEVSNVYRNGKCISYKPNWRSKQFSREEVHQIYLNRLKSAFIPDIKKIDELKKKKHILLSNAKKCYLGDVRQTLDSKVENSSVDLVITSPPYLNSRDYTDTYMIELRVLDYLNDDEQVRELRKNTIRSHVQVNWEESSYSGIKELDSCIKKISKHKDKFWNNSLLDMINGYFEDMDNLFKILYEKMKFKGRIYFNVANSAYYNVEVEVDVIVAKIAEKNGFKVIEIREARRINPSSQQKEKIEYLRESVIVIAKQ